jgi:hypothetical protein
MLASANTACLEQQAISSVTMDLVRSKLRLRDIRDHRHEMFTALFECPKKHEAYCGTRSVRESRVGRTEARTQMLAAGDLLSLRQMIEAKRTRCAHCEPF